MKINLPYVYEMHGRIEQGRYWPTRNSISDIIASSKPGELGKASRDLVYTSEYSRWATRAERQVLPADREVAALLAARIRKNGSGSRRDQEELARLERLAGFEGPRQCR